MQYPRHRSKHLHPALFTADHFFRYMESEGEFLSPSPRTVVLHFSPRLAEFARRRLGARSVPGHKRLLVVGKGRGAVGVAEVRGIGAPALAVSVEEHAALGCRRFISVGLAGALQPDLPVGSTVVCTRAIRDEGTSYHYVRPSKYARPTKELTSKLGSWLTEAGLDFLRGSSWTVDAVYRETLPELRTYRKEGVLTVEMEASALFAISRALAVEAAAVFTVSDLLDEAGWEPRFVEARPHVEALLVTVVRALQRHPLAAID